MPVYPSPISEIEMQARRAISGWWYQHNTTATIHLLRGSWGTEWKIRQTKPRRPFAISNNPRGNKARKMHRVRDQLVATKDDYEFRVTRYWCGAYAYGVDLHWDTDRVCSMCDVRFRGATAGTVSV